MPRIRLLPPPTLSGDYPCAAPSPSDHTPPRRLCIVSDMEIVSETVELIGKPVTWGRISRFLRLSARGASERDYEEYVEYVGKEDDEGEHEVVMVGERTRGERDAELRRAAIDVDPPAEEDPELDDEAFARTKVELELLHSRRLAEMERLHKEELQALDQKSCRS